MIQNKGYKSKKFN